MSSTQQLLLGEGAGGAPAGYQIQRSLRFNSADSAYLSRTPASASNRKTWTWSAWVKKSALGGTQALFTATIASPTTDSNLTSFGFNSSDRISIGGGLTTFLETSQVFRDLSAWYHLVCAVDTTQATADNRVRFYVNGSEITAFASRSNPTQNLDTAVNSTVQHNISSGQPWQARYFNGYLTEINFIDGQALTPSSFGETDSNTGVWKPKAYSGTYGTNGFYVNFSDNSGTTSTTLGKDYSGNGNNWTPNNFSVTAGAGNDSLVDSPTAYGTDTGVGGEVRGNYCTWNPLAKPAASSTSNGNLTAVTTTAADERIFSTIAVSSGKWYWEVTPTAISVGGCMVAVTSSAYEYKTANLASGDDGYGYYTTGNKYNPSTATSYGNTFTTNDVIGVALDMDNGKIYFSKNGTFQNSGDPVAGTNAAFTSISGTYSPSVSNGGATSSCTVEANFGQRAFAYTAPSGFKALCTQNLPTPTIGATSTTQANDYFNPVLYTGTGSSLGVTGVGFQPDLVWIKGRSGATDHGWYDAVRGVQLQLESNTTTAETTETTGLTAFGSDGFTVGALAQLNTSSATYVAWNWKANGAGSTNTAGTITSTVSANTTSGFSIGIYTGTGVNATVGHGLGVAPSMIIIKMRSSPGDQAVVYHSALGANKTLRLDSTGAAGTTTVTWQNTAPSTTVFSIGDVSENNLNNANGKNYVAYCFAAVAGYSAFGSYTGNGSADGPFVFTNFRPRYVMVKRTDSTGSWYVWDTARDTYNWAYKWLAPNSTSAENTSSGSNVWDIDILSNGFKIRNDGAFANASGGTYIYMALAENPFKYSLGR